MIGQGPQQALLVLQVFREDPLPHGVISGRPVVIAIEVVGRETAVVVGVRLTVGHERRMPGGLRFPGFKIPQQQFITLRIIVGRFFEREPVLGAVGRAHAEAIRLHPPVAAAVFRGRVGQNAGQQPTGRITRRDIRIDAWLQLVICRLIGRTPLSDSS